ncbi:MAG: hypothetical protein H6988_03030 [Pseudomonadales bacterium]|nr:hypothetical protein [Pseudomonadales bacterium]
MADKFNQEFLLKVAPLIRIRVPKEKVKIMSLIYYKNGVINFPLYANAVKTLLEHPSNRYHFTVNPKDGYHDWAYYEAMNFLLVLINQMLFGKRYMNRDCFIEGYVVREQKPGDDSPHFHFIFIDRFGLLDCQKHSLYHCLSEALWRLQGDSYKPRKAHLAIQIAARKSRQRDDGTGHTRKISKEERKVSRLVGEKSWCLQDYYIPEEGVRLERYLTKTILDASKSVKEKLSLFGVLGKDTIWWGDWQSSSQYSAAIRHQVNREFERFGTATMAVDKTHEKHLYSCH